MKKHEKICEQVRNAGGNPFLVGGFVRDTLLGRKPKDVDLVVVGLTREQLQEVFPDAQWVGNSFPVLLVDGIEVALARKEEKVGVGHTGFDCVTDNVTLKEDLFRRDLTINAMAMDPFTGDVFDPYNGVCDLKRGALMHVSDHFCEDPLRVLRAARFAAQLDMQPTYGLIREAQKVLGELATLPGERVFAELHKALRTQEPSVFFNVLDEMGALEIVFPELHALKNRTQPEKYHPEGDAYVHTMLVVDRARQLGADDATMFAALTHDLGKAITPDDNLPHHYNHEALGVPLVDKMCERLHAPNDWKQVARITAKEHLNVHRFLDLKPVKKVRMLMRLGAVHGDNLILNVGLASQADAQGRGPDFLNAEYPQRQAMLDAAKALRTVRGDQFVHLKDGQKIAQNMERERAKVLKGAGF